MKGDVQIVKSLLQTNRRAFIGTAGALGASASLFGTAGAKTKAPLSRLESLAYRLAQEANGDQIIFGLPWDAITLNPIVEQDGVSYLVNLWIYDALIRLDEELNPVPELAETWEPSDDGLTWTLNLRSDVIWHDGEPFTAEDVAFTIYKILEPTTNTQYRPNYAPLIGFDELTNPDNPAKPSDLEQEPVEVVDAHTVRFHLSEPFAPFLTQSLHLPIAPKHLLEGVDVNSADLNTSPVGTGAYRFVDWQRDNRMVLESFDDYYGESASIHNLVLRVIPDETVLLQELRTGGVDFIERVPREAVAELENSPEYDVTLVDNIGATLITFNLDHPVLQDTAVRQAVGYALDMDLFIEAILLGLAEPATGLYPPYSWMYEPDVQRYAYDPDESRRLLDEAGWSEGNDGIREREGQRLEFKMSTFLGHEAGEQFLAAAQKWLAEVGIAMEIEIIELATWIDSFVNSTFDATMSNWDGSADPDGYGYGMYHSAGGRNRALYQNPEMDVVLEEARETIDQEVRKQAYSKMQKIAMEDVPYLPLYHYQHIYAHRSDFDGFVPSPMPADIYRSVKQVISSSEK